MRTVWGLVLGFWAAAAIGAERPPVPAVRSDPVCDWRWVEGGGLGLWTERCPFATGDWRVEFRERDGAFVLMRDADVVQVVVQPFRKAAEAPVAAILPELRAGGYIPDDDDCGFAPALIRPAPRTIAFFEIRPTGSRLAAFEATPGDMVPDPPCPDYGWSTHGVRYFVSDLARPETVVFVNVGQDGTFIAPETITLE